MGPCVYTTQFPIWLDAAVSRPETDAICFRSNKRWAKAAKLLDRHGTLPVLFRKQEDSDVALACRYVADLMEIHFPNRMKDDPVRFDWLNDKLWLQRDVIKKIQRSDRFPTWESQFKAWEIEKFMNAETWYIVCNVREIKPLPLACLRKLADDHPLASNYTRGYSLCHYPATEIQFVGRAAESHY